MAMSEIPASGAKVLYGVVVFDNDNEPHAASVTKLQEGPVSQLSYIGREWFIVKCHRNICFPFYNAY